MKKHFIWKKLECAVTHSIREQEAMILLMVSPNSKAKKLYMERYEKKLDVIMAERFTWEDGSRSKQSRRNHHLARLSNEFGALTKKALSRLRRKD
jgi:hypothetical protein